MYRIGIYLALLLLFLPGARAQEYKLVVYGATPAGIAAALAAARDGEKVLLVEPSARIGGLLTNGLSHADFRTFEALTGAFLQFSGSVADHYRDAYGADSAQARGNFRGTHGEPKVNLAVLEKMLAAQPRITVRKQWVLEGVKSSSGGIMRAVEVALFVDADKGRHAIPASFFVDATYEGDLMAAAGVQYRVGREGRGDLGEPLAPELPDSQLQAYNFRLCMTQDEANRVAPGKPEGYDRDFFADILPLLSDGKITGIFGMTASHIYKAHLPPLPNGKFDINDQSRGRIRLSLPGENLGWPDGDAGVALRAGVSPGLEVPPYSRRALATSRATIFAEHLLWNVGLLYFLQNDEAVPPRFQDEARKWGLCRDEFTDSQHLPSQLYVREARRMVGIKVFVQQDTEHAPGDARAVLKRDAVAMGDYGPNCHGTGREGSSFDGKHTGEFYQPSPPYQIPYSTLVPSDVENLLVPGACSASHVGFCALRLEPIWMSLGEAAGHAAHLAIQGRIPAQQVPVARIQALLHKSGAATIYVSDVPPLHPDFALVQSWGTAGGFHGLAPAPATPGQRGEKILGQYFQAFPSHAAGLDEVLTPALEKAWRALAEQLKADTSASPPADGSITRGSWLRSLKGLP